jgi:deazaflavin-dependent oxidoreductase (nitroreductase family)
MTNADLPPRLARMSRVPYRLLTWGVPMGPLALLRTRGRRSGLLRTAPVALLRQDDQEWLISPFGETHWVHNVRADGHAELGRGRRLRQVRLTEIDDDRKPGLLLAYRRKFGVVPFVRYAFQATPQDGLAAFQQEAGRHPIFLIERN